MRDAHLWMFFPTSEHFRENVKVGDVLTGYGTQLKVTVTAVGRNSFLYIDGAGFERVATMRSKQARWRKPWPVTNLPEVKP